MSVTAKQIAKELNISAAAVSMALNNKPGVSTETRKIVIETAKRMGYDFSKTDNSKNDDRTIAFVFFHKNFVFETPFFTELALSIENVLKENGYKLIIHHIHDLDNVEEQLEIIKYRGCSGMILLGTVMLHIHLVRHITDEELVLLVMHHVSLFFVSCFKSLSQLPSP